MSSPHSESSTAKFGSRPRGLGGTLLARRRPDRQARWSLRILFGAVVLLLAVAPIVGPETSAAAQSEQPKDEEYTARIHRFTTEPQFITPLVEFLPASDTVPTPLDFHGYIAGEEGHLTYAADVHRYIRAVAEASPRVTVRTMGMTEEGRERLLVLASSEETIANLDRYQNITAGLADPRGLSDEDARAMIAEGKPFYWAVGGLHSPETGSPEMLQELIYRLAVEDRPFFQEIRDNAIVMVTPVMEVDGRERIVDIMRYRKANPDMPAPPLLYWGKYVAHDNNRDGIGLALSLSRQSIDTFLTYHPQVMHDLHESVPFLYVMSGHGPFNPWLDPIVTEEWTEMAWIEVRQMNAWNVPGVWTYDFWDGWASNYMIYAALGRNAIGRFYETFGNSVPDTMERDIGRQSGRAWFRMNPPYPKVMWSLRNNTNLMQSALLVGIHNVATNKDRFLETFYLKSRRAAEKAHTEGPAAWLIPADQPRPILTTRLVNLLRGQSIQVHRADEAFAVDAERGPEKPAEETEFAAGTFVVRMDQPYSRLADMLLDYQYFNPRDPRPYDDTGWTLGPLFNVETYRVKDVTVLQVSMEELGSDIKPAGGVRGRDPAVWLVSATGEPEMAALRYRLAEVPMRAAEEPFELDGHSFSAGTFIIRAVGGDLRSRLDSLGRELGMEIIGASSEPPVAAHEVSAPRIALLHNWSRTQNEGWYRLALDELEIPYDYISIQDVGDVADLRSRWDVILVAPGIGNFSSVVNGSFAPAPIPYQTTELTPNLGHIDSTPDTRRGMGYEGLIHLKSFVEQGGLLLTMTTSSSLPVEAGITPFVGIDATPPDLQARGSIFNAKVTDPSSPIAYGYDENVAVYFRDAPLLRVAVGGGFRRFFGGGGDPGRPSGRRGEDMVPGRRPLEPDEQEEAEEERVADERWTNVDDLMRDTDPRFAASLPSPETHPRIVMRFAERADDLLVSGMLDNGRALAARPAIIDAPLGEGHVVMFAINPVWRHQTWGQFGLLFNTILHYDSLDVGGVDAHALTEESGEQ